jgi:CubicO group peptidase (beta-lactamase class C family)
VTSRSLSRCCACLWSCAAARCPRRSRGASPAVGDRVNRLDGQLEDLRRTLKIPGISAAVVKDQKLLWVKGLGSADVENTTPATPETNYRIASLTKPFASMLLMQLVERGKLDLDEPMAKYSPEFGSASAAGRSRCATCGPIPRMIRLATPTGTMATDSPFSQTSSLERRPSVPRAAREEHSERDRHG